MASIPRSLGALAPKAHRLVLSAFLGASAIIIPLGAVAQTTPAAHHHVAAKMKRETVEQRIAMLHGELKITPGEEAGWTPVAQAMRDNEAAMQKLVAQRTAQAPKAMSAVEDLRTYEKFTRAHVSGLKNLISSFETLYQAMPEPQKALADQVFHKFGARGPQHAA